MAPTKTNTANASLCLCERPTDHTSNINCCRECELRFLIHKCTIHNLLHTLVTLHRAGMGVVAASISQQSGCVGPPAIMCPSTASYGRL